MKYFIFFLLKKKLFIFLNAEILLKLTTCFLIKKKKSNEVK